MIRKRAGTTCQNGLYGAVCVEVIPSANTTRVGENVTFRLLSLVDIKSGVWDFQNKLLVFWIGDQTEPQDKRATVNTSTGALTLSSVTVADSGVYRLMDTTPPIQANATLTVLEPVSNVVAKVSVSDPVEFNDTVTLTCSASGSSLSFKWLNVSSDITDSEHVALKDDNRTLIISNVSRFDHGPFYCVVSNGIGHGTSPAQNLNISCLYGAVCVEVIPSANTTRVGENVTFRLLSLVDIKSGVWDFQNKSLVFWIGDKTVPQDKRATVNTSTGALTLSSVTVADSGVYRLMDTTPPIQANATLTVLEPVSNVVAKVSVSDPVEFNDTVTLTCSASGSSLSFKWLNVSSDITDSEHVALKDDNRTLIISNVSRFDHGPFYCVVSNGIGHGTSPAQNLNIS
ncbi:hypothetical protein SKAU_G00223160 [Synaphobranchus kaupii]|uniref:Ig-like domain-containing protein n=1 Tax=Synaphobranchus kaupii TaxID=118154 RepID=A0A9Q1FBI8_SYNKA|nr:hypothetical protein SKAU_G00223160 [Synaphobranchus kaupii]